MSMLGVCRPELCRPDRHAVVRIVSAAIRCRASPRPAAHGTAKVKLRHYPPIEGTTVSTVSMRRSALSMDGSAGLDKVEGGGAVFGRRMSGARSREAQKER